MDLSVRTGGQKVTLKDRVKDRKPPPIKLIQNIHKNDTLTTPDIQKAIQTPDLRKILIRNQQELGPISGLNLTGPFGEGINLGGNIKEEVESNPPSVEAVVTTDKAEEIVQADSPPNPHTGRVMEPTEEITTMALGGLNGQEAVMASLMASTNKAVALPSKLPTVPVDMTVQEQEKVERKRHRNRLAATKCRKRKIEKITVLEKEVKDLNESLQAKMKEKRELEIEVEEIRNRIKIHIKQGCTGLEEYLID